MKKKILLSSLLAISLLCTVSGCGNQDTDTSDKSSGEAASTTEASGETPTLTYWTPINGSAAKFIKSYNENTAYQQAMKDTGVNIEFVHPAVGQEKEQFNLLFAAGDLPDIIAYAQNYVGGEFQGMRDGVFKNITEDIKTKAPDYFKYLQEDQEFYREATDNEGDVVAFYGYKPVGDPPFRRWILNEALLNELGCEIPQTIDEFEAMFDKMLAKGITPYVPENSPGKTGYEQQLMGLWDIVKDFYVDNGEIKFGQIQDNFKKYLELMNRWYQKGYTSKDFTSLESTELNTLFDTGKIGTFLGPIVANFNRCEALGIKVVAAPYPRLEAGQKLHYNDCDIWPAMKTQNETVVVLSNTCSDVDAAMKFLNYGYTKEGADLYNWGVEGVNWDWSGDTRVYNDLMLNNKSFGTEEASYIYKVHFGAIYTYPDTECHANLLKSEGALNSRLQWADDENVDSSLQRPPYQLDEADQQLLGEIQTQVNTYSDEMVLKFITGAESLDEFDNYVETIKSMGIDKAIIMMQKGYDEYIKKAMK